jgi:2-methylcitrate dehydratase PrpD
MTLSPARQIDNASAADNSLSLTQRLSQYWAKCQFDDLPDPVKTAAKRHLLDTLAAGINASSTEAPQAVLRAVACTKTKDTDSATIWGHATYAQAPHAALVNGTSCHGRELDDYGGCGHNGAVVVPALCAVAETGGASGKDVLTALAAGYDVAGRVTNSAGGYRFHNDRGWHSTGTCGSFGAAAAAARVMGLDVDRFANALGIAGTYVGGIWAFLVDGAMTKRLHPGKSAESGVMAARLAKGGLTGPKYVMEAEWGGFFKTYCGPEARPEALLENLGNEFVLTTTSGLKPYPSCRGIHSSLDSLLDLMAEHAFDAAEIEGMVVHGTQRQIRQLAGRRIDSVLDAQFSLPYSLAMAALRKRSTLDEYIPLQADQPEVQRLMDLVEVRATRDMSYLGEPTLEVQLKNGPSLHRLTEAPRGSPLNPMSDSDLERKAMILVTPVLGARRARALIDAVMDIDKLSDFRDFAPLLRAESA